MTILISTERVKCDNGGNPVSGNVVWAPAKSIWLTSMTLIALVGAPLTFSFDALAIFLVLSAVTVCGGHSVGMHRMLIHKAFRAPKWLERLLVYLGTLVSMEGPLGMIRLHDHRDWGQRQANCHDFFSHRAGFWRDAWWQLHCKFDYENPPQFQIEPEIAEDRFYKAVQATWYLQQIPLAGILLIAGGVSWVIWGIAVRVSVSLIGHWVVGYFAHQPRAQSIYVEGMGVQGYNVPGIGLLTAGESYHENHHAYPSSAKLGFAPGQVDPGWWLVAGLRRMGLIDRVNTPDNLPLPKTVRVSPSPSHYQSRPALRTRRGACPLGSRTSRFEPG